MKTRLLGILTAVLLCLGVFVPATTAHASSPAPAGARIVADIGANESVIQLADGTFAGLITDGPFAGSVYDWQSPVADPVAAGFFCVYSWAEPGANAAAANEAESSFYETHTSEIFVYSFDSPGGCVYMR